MRDIKFRAKDRKDGNWAYGHLYYSHGTGEWQIIHGDGWIPTHNSPDEGEGDIRHTVAPETAGEFTGLVDNSGNDIYEDDFVCFPNIAQTVLIKRVGASFGYDHWGEHKTLKTEGVTLEVSGNMHDPRYYKGIEAREKGAHGRDVVCCKCGVHMAPFETFYGTGAGVLCQGCLAERCENRRGVAE